MISMATSSREKGRVIAQVVTAFRRGPDEDLFAMERALGMELQTDPFAAAEKLADPLPGVSIHLEFVEVPGGVFREMLGLRGDALAAAVSEQIEAGGGAMLGSARLVTKSGQRAQTEDVHEFIHATEYHPPGDLRLLSGEGGFMDLKFPPRIEGVPDIPNAFDMRPVGMTFEVDPVVSPGGTLVDLNLAPEIVRFVGTYETGPKVWAFSYRPIFATQKVTTAVTVEPGVDEIVAALTPREDTLGDPRSDRVVLVICRVDLVEVVPGG